MREKAVGGGEKAKKGSREERGREREREEKEKEKEEKLISDADAQDAQ